MNNENNTIVCCYLSKLQNRNLFDEDKNSEARIS